MPKKKYLVTLGDKERDQLEQLLRSGHMRPAKSPVRASCSKRLRAGRTMPLPSAICGRATVERIRQRFVEEGLGALAERPRPGTQPKLDEKAEARLIAEACSDAPEGRKRWTLHLLADRVVVLGLAESYSYESVRRVLKKVPSSRG